MPEQTPGQDQSAFDQLLNSPSSGGEFTIAFRGYDKAEVDAALAELAARANGYANEIATLKDAQHRATREAKSIETRIAELERELAQRDADVALEAARAATAEDRVQTLTEELLDTAGQTASRQRFEEVLHVAEEQASVLIKNASIQADRLLAAAEAEGHHIRAQAKGDADAIIARAEHDASQARLRIDTELTAHAAQLERERAHGAEKVSQAQQEAAAIRTEAEKGATALRSMVARETEQMRAEAEEAVRELRMRSLEFEESLTRRQDDAQQEFLVLHNQAVSHAERITQDANDQVASSLEHAQRVAAKADDFDRLMRAQAQQIEADANARARENLERSRAKAQKIIDTVTAHSQAVLRDAEDRTRALRWQQHQLTSFMSEVKELMRGGDPLEGPDDIAETAGAADDAADDAAEADVRAGETATEIGDLDAELDELVEDAERAAIVEDESASADKS